MKFKLNVKADGLRGQISQTPELLKVGNNALMLAATLLPMETCFIQDNPCNKAFPTSSRDHNFETINDTNIEFL